MIERRRSFLSNMEYIDGMTIINISGTILFSVKFNPSLNPNIDEAYDIIGKNLFSVFKSVDKDTSTLIKAMELGKPVNRRKQKVIDARDNEIHTMNLSIPIKVNGAVIGAVELSRDISSHKDKHTQEIKMDNSLFNNRSIIKKYLGPNRARYTLNDIISNNHKINELKHFVKKVADGMAPVFIYGETGTGKELFAHGIHNESNRTDKPFISQNCAAIPENLLESILFGTTKGSFTGACDSPGLFELAEGGTLFLDEINSMPINLQAKLLRVLEDGYVRRLGDKNERKVNLRVISASNMNPLSCVKKGMLRQDIYYRLSVLVISIPSLRERREDIQLLLNYFISKYNNLLNKKVNKVSKEVYNIFNNYSWPGNVRELEHIIEFAMNIVDKSENTIELEHIESRIEEISEDKDNDFDLPIQPLKEAVSKIEKDLISKVIIRTKGNVSAAARILEIPRQTLQRKMNNYGINSSKSFD